MLKFFFWLLLAANAVMFAYQRGYLESVLPSGREPQRLARQLRPEAIRLVPKPPPEPKAEPNPDAAQPSAPAAPAAPASAVVPPSTSTAGGATTAVAATPAAAADCVEIGNFGNDDAKRFAALLPGLGARVKVARRNVPEVASHIVYIPPQGSKEGAERKAGELRRLGINDFFIIQDDSSLRWGISLGVFKQEDAARAHLLSLRQKGVHSARLGERSVSANMTAFQLRGLDAQGKAALAKIGAVFPRQSTHRCAPPSAQ
jgi:hypothetical protein